MVIYIKEEPTMQISVSSALTVYHDGQFCGGCQKLQINYLRIVLIHA